MVVKTYKDYMEKKEKFIRDLKGKFGCILEFHGFVREYDLKNGKEVPSRGLNIDKKILEKLKDIKKEAKKKFDLVEILIYHNIGFLKIGERIASISVFAKHREEAFSALAFIIDEIKKYH
ncbi:molybdenum cofactor biosynthesis protein MoaE [Thermodesulfobacterium hydrogeniphilum]|uniref:molybdenum cofactor biosynthesis protein MoaE n=1 Tax=Thermodesulfobacterium hydrogeniphilum TaxID=161156 RepID=UPI00057060E2|nr:molybdenum cofactor biosynthesis protein MoaE [Thermodesulfobacterium hydrogeniphilum]